MLEADEIATMSRAERLTAMEHLWASLSADGVELPSPDWHLAVLQARAARAKDDEARWLSVDELQERLRDQ